jgi:leucyl/phenylalanyl-tRNA--protein transferase
LILSSIYDDDFYIPELRSAHIFPNPREAGDEGLLAFGGDLTPNRILKAYRNGIFPWFNPEDPILWWSPNPRLLLYPEDFKTSKSFRRVLRNKGFEVRFDTNFEAVITHCGEVPREGQEGTWLTDEMREAYIKIYEMGFAHSVETYYEGELVGGLYGLALGKVFFGESMFSLVSDASKVAFKALSDVLGRRGYDFIDCQMKTDHMIGLGAEVVERDRYLDELNKSVVEPAETGDWQHFSWEYEELEK